MAEIKRPRDKSVVKKLAAVFISRNIPRLRPQIMPTSMLKNSFNILAIGALSLNILATGLPAFLANYENQQKYSSKILSAENLSTDLPETVPAADAQQVKAKNKPENLSRQLQDKLAADRDAMLKGNQRDRRHVQVLDEGRSETGKVYLNADGTKSLVRTFQASSFKDKEGKWRDVDASVAEDKANNKWRTKANSWEAAFGDVLSQGVEVTNDGQTFRFTPVGANSVKPVVTGDAPNQIITYRNVWQGIDLKYEVAGSQIKESIVVKSKVAASSFAFETNGAKLAPNPDQPESFNLDGAFSKFQIAPPTVDTADGKVVADGAHVSQSTAGSRLTVELDSNWLKSLDTAAFPVVILSLIHI